MNKYRILVGYSDGNLYEDYVGGTDDEVGVLEHVMALMNKIEDIVGEEDFRYPPMYILGGERDPLRNSEFAFYKLELPEEKYLYLFFKKAGITAGTPVNMFPILLSLNDEDVKDIKDFWISLDKGD